MVNPTHFDLHSLRVFLTVAETGSLTRALEASAQLPGPIGHDVPSQLLKAGRRLDLHPASEAREQRPPPSGH
jgi:hypothetical protein